MSIALKLLPKKLLLMPPHHTRLGLVGWIAYWCLGDSALAVDIVVPLIKTLGLTELVSDALASR
jgi:hypothetical protein